MSGRGRGELRELYQEFILDHGKHPRNYRVLPAANRGSVGFNPLCGDRVELRAFVDEHGRIQDIGFQGAGCAISTAAASTMTEAVKGMDAAEAEELFERFLRVVTGSAAESDLDELGKLAAFAGIAEFPVRIKCATLAWRTLQAALAGRGLEDDRAGVAATEVSTE